VPARRSKPVQGFPSKDLIGVRASRIRSIMALMASGQWGGRLTEIIFAREWDLSLEYVQELASAASAHIQLTVTTDFAATLRSRMLASTEAMKAKLAEVVFDPSQHGSSDRYEISNDGEHWFEVPRKDALKAVQTAVKVRRVPCVPLASLPSFVQTAIRCDEAMERIVNAMPPPPHEGGSDGDGTPRNGPRPVGIVYTGVEPPQATEKPPEPKA
jgi:hypothetical protein